jgi:hypothetical protein
MRTRIKILSLAFGLCQGLFPAFASGSFEAGYADRLYEMQFRQSPEFHRSYQEDSPFYVGVEREGIRRSELSEPFQRGEIGPYNPVMDVRPVEIQDEIAIVRTANTRRSTLKICYDSKGNIVSIHAWDNATGKDLDVNLDVLAEPIVKDEIESSVAKLRIVYNAYGEVVSKAAWNRVTGEKINVPSVIPFTNYVNEDKYWAYVERQKYFDRGYEDLYVDRGHIRTKRMKKIVRHNNPFGVPQEIEVYEERPIVERHYSDIRYSNDGYFGFHNAEMSGSIKGLNSSAEIVPNKSTYMELGTDLNLFRRHFEFNFVNMSNDSTLRSVSAGFQFDNIGYGAGTRFNWDVKQLELLARRKFVRSEEGDFGINWLYSLNIMDVDFSLSQGNNKSEISGLIAVPTFGMEVLKNWNDHFDWIGSAKFFALSGVSLFDMYFGAKYYFRPENVDDWRFNIGYKSFKMAAEDDNDEVDMSHSGLRFSLERSF